MNSILQCLTSKYLTPFLQKLESPVIENEYKGPFLYKSCVLNEKLISQICQEAKEQCASFGYKIESVKFCSVADFDIINEELSISSTSNQCISVCKKDDGTYFAIIFFGEVIKAS